MAGRFKHYDAAGTFTLLKVQRLERVVVNKGLAGATVTIRYANDDVIAIIAADNPDIGRVYNLEFGGGGVSLEVVLSGANDVTIIYD